MSPEQKQDIINRLTQEYRDAKAEASLIEAQANSVGRNFLEIGKTLTNRPDEFHGAPGEIDPNPVFQEVYAWTERLRELRLMMPRLMSQLQAAGADVS